MPLVKGCVGICPSGALGVSFLDKLVDSSTRSEDEHPPAVLLDRPGSARRLLRGLRVRGQGRAPRVYELPRYYRAGTLREVWVRGELPELLVMGPNPDQISEVLHGLADLLVGMQEATPLTPERVEQEFPVVVFVSNGVFFYQDLVELEGILTEAMVLGRIPTITFTEDKSFGDTFYGKFVRGPTLQNGVRLGSGEEAVYLPGKPSGTQLAGGSPGARELARKLLSPAGSITVCAPDANVALVELEKAFVNLAVNFIGVIASAGADGSFDPLNLGQVLGCPGVAGDLATLSEVICAMGQAMRGPGYLGQTGEQRLAGLKAKLTPLSSHVSSSVQLVQAALDNRTLTPGLTPTEHWLLKPLQHLASSAGLSRVRASLDALEMKYLQALTRVCAKHGLLQEAEAEDDQCTRAHASESTLAAEAALASEAVHVLALKRRCQSLQMQRNAWAAASVAMLAALLFSKSRVR